MATASRATRGNRLLEALSAQERALLTPHLERRQFKLRDPFERPNRRIDDVYFLESGIASVVAQHPDGRRVEIGIIGREGMSGSAVVLGSDRSPHATFIQAAGEGYRVPAAALRKAMAESSSLHGVLTRYVQAFMVQTAHTAIANARATLTERLARWLLMAHDRVEGNVLSLTHEFLSLMMAVRRAGVTEALQALEGRNLIACGRAEITVLDRKGIETIAGHYYGTPEAEYRRLMR
jgi:CRP-like cAMP-binding protein